jgi:hypothetical protein
MQVAHHKPVQVEEVEAALRNIRGGQSPKIRDAGPTEVGEDWTANLSLQVSSRHDWSKLDATLMVRGPGGVAKSVRIPTNLVERVSDRPVTIGLTPQAAAEIAPRLHRFLLGQQAQICPAGYLYACDVREIRYQTEWPGEGWQVRLTLVDYWISARLLRYHPKVVAAVEAAELEGREKYSVSRLAKPTEGGL